MDKGQTVFAFDFGKASLGEAVRTNSEIKHRESLLISEDFASIDEARTRRRALRTRLSHAQREKNLNEICRQAGLEILSTRDIKKGILGDIRLEKEFPSKEESISYNSALLRIKLLRGEKLESWQIYKALRSAMQRRGYDKDITWSKSYGDDSEENKKSVESFQNEYSKMTSNPERRYLCYYDAWKMGLWNPETDTLKEKIDCNAERARGYTAPRKEVEKELKELIAKAALFFPFFKNKEDYILYGKSEKAYSSYHNVEGVLGQKVPRFSNRLPDKCRLIPRLNVCSASDMLAMQVTFLMKLKNMRFQRNGKIDELKASELKKLLDSAMDNSKNKKPASAFKIGKREWKKTCRDLNGLELNADDEVEAPKNSGRSSFCRPALRIMRELLISGITPHALYKQKKAEIKNGPLKGLIETDLNFLLKMPDDWSQIYIPAQGLEIFQNNSASNEESVRKLIGSIGDPIVRHRLELFSKRIDKLVKEFGEPSDIVMEFVRKDFLGPKALKSLEAFQKNRRERREQAKQYAETLGLSGNDAILKAELFIQQAGQNPYPPKTSTCVYTGTCLEASNMDSWHIDHIVPRRGKYNGSNSPLNLVLTSREANQEKADRTPFEWLHGDPDRWDQFVSRVNSMDISPKKKKLLLYENAPEEDQKQTALIETAWIAKLAQTLVHLKFGWKLGAEGEARRVIVIPGGLTAKIRRKYKLNSILYKDLPDDMDPDELPKNREDKRHHALDAMVLAYLPNWIRDINKRDFFKFPSPVKENPKEYFANKIQDLIPFHICREKPVLEETFYAKRKINNEEKMVKRVQIAALPMKNISFNLKQGTTQAQSIIDDKIRNDLLNFFATNPSKEAWFDFIAKYRLSPNGPLVKKAAVIVGETEEYKDMLSKSIPGRGQYKRGRSRNGCYIYLDKKKKPKVAPVYVFQSPEKVKKELADAGFEIINNGEFYTANCLIELSKDVILADRTIPHGKYLCSSIKSNGQVDFEGTDPILKNPIGIAHLVNAGFKKARL